MTEKQLLARDAKRDIGAELLLSVRQMKAGKVKIVARVDVPAVTLARLKSGLSQADFANLLGVSVRTLQDWEQGRRQPSGAARTLITIAEQQPKVLIEVFKNLESV
ncbi:MAG: helix-turn-helix domain-containing protein [Polaromonas sp.]